MTDKRKEKMVLFVEGMEGAPHEATYTERWDGSGYISCYGLVEKVHLSEVLDAMREYGISDFRVEQRLVTWDGDTECSVEVWWND